MKKVYFFLWAAVFLFCLPMVGRAQVPIDETTFPDSVFRDYVKTNFDTDGDGMLSEEECGAVKEIDVSDKSSLADLMGIEHFPALQVLRCCNTGIRSLDVSQNPALWYLDCSNTGITSLDLSQNQALEGLDCSNTGLMSLTLSQDAYFYRFDCSNTCLTSLDLAYIEWSPYISPNIENQLGMIELQNDGTADLSSLPGFDVSRSIEWQGGSVEGTMLRFDDSKVARYKYLTRVPGQGRNFDTMSVTLVGIDKSLIPITEKKFPDSLFRGYIRENFDRDGNDTLNIQEICTAKEINVSGQGRVTSLSGIEYFPALITLKCSATSLTSLDLNRNVVLKNLFCSDLSRVIEVQDDGVFDLSSLPDFDVNRAFEWQGGSVEGTMLIFGKRKVARYKYLTKYSESGTYGMDVVSITLLGTDKVLVPITSEYFPDSIFQSYVRENFDSDGNDTLSMLERRDVNSINVNGQGGLMSLSGIEYFPALEYLSCSNTGIINLDLTGFTNLREVYCYNVDTISLDVSGCTNLTRLDFEGSELISLDASDCTTLSGLDFSNTRITNLDVSGCTNLMQLYFEGSELIGLDASGCTTLYGLAFFNTKITDLDVSDFTSLSELYFIGSELISLDVSGCTALSTLYFDNTKMKTLDLSGCTALLGLDCSNTGLTSLDLGGCTALSGLDCSNTGLTSLDLGGCTALSGLDCSNTGIMRLDVSQNPNLEELYCSNTGLTILNIAWNTVLSKLDCSNTNITSLDLTWNKDLFELYCSNTCLTSLDLSLAPSLDVLECQNSYREVKAEVGGTYDLSKLPNFDVSRARGWRGGSVQGTILTFHSKEVSYQYTTLYSGPNTNVPATLEFKLVANPNLSLVSEPVFSPDSGSVVEKGDTIRLECVTEGAVIYYGLGEDAEPDQEYKTAEGIVISQDTTYLTAWAMLAGEDTSEVVNAVYYVKIEEPEPDTVHVVLPSGLEAKVDGNSVTLGWDSEEKHVYQLRVQGHGMQDTLGAEVESAGAYTEYRFTDVEEGTYSWAVRVIRVEETDTLSRYVEGEDFVIGEVSVDGELLSGIRLYPNPSSGSFQVEVGESVRLDIFSASGVRVLGRDLEPGTEALELSASGLYLLRFTTTDGRVAYRRMVVR